MANGMDFQSIYREHAYEVYRDAFEELRDAEQTRECVYQVFSRIRAEGLTDPAEIRAKIPEYRAAYVAQIKTARLDVDQVWYRIRNDELTEKATEDRGLPSFRDRLRDEARKTREAAVRQAALTGAEREEAPAEAPEAETIAAADPGTEIQADPGVELTPAAEPDELPIGEVGAEEPLYAKPLLTDPALEEPAAEEPAFEEPAEAEPAFEEPVSEEPAAEEPVFEGPDADVFTEPGEELPAEEAAPEEEFSEEPAAVPAPAGPEEMSVPEEDEPVRRKGSRVYWVIFVIVLVIFLWVLADILMYKGILPGIDLGYSWFNEHLFQLFPYS